MKFFEDNFTAVLVLALIAVVIVIAVSAIRVERFNMIFNVACVEQGGAMVNISNRPACVKLEPIAVKLVR